MKFEIWFPLLVGLGPTIIGLLALRGQYKKQSADASEINVNTAIKLMKKLETKVDFLSIRLDESDIREDEYVRCLRTLIRQIEDLGIIPNVTLQHVNNIAQMEVQK